MNPLSGYNVFGITKGGRCLASGNAYKLFTEHSNSVGPGKDCLDEKGNFLSLVDLMFHISLSSLLY